MCAVEQLKTVEERKSVQARQMTTGEVHQVCGTWVLLINHTAFSEQPGRLKTHRSGKVKDWSNEYRYYYMHHSRIQYHRLAKRRHHAKPSSTNGVQIRWE